VVLSTKAQWRLLVIGLVLFALLLLGALAYERVSIMQEQRHRLATKARVIEENITRQMLGVNNALRSVQRDLELFTNLQQPDFLNLRLKSLVDAMPGVRTMNVIDGSGTILASNREEVIGVNLAYREYFATAVQDRDPAALYLSRPFETLAGVYSINLVRVSLGPSGEAVRVVAATLDSEFFDVLLSSVRFADDVWVALVHIDGILALRIPSQPGQLGAQVDVPDGLFRQHLAAGLGYSVLDGNDALTGEAVWMAQRTVTGNGLGMKGQVVVAVARDPDEALRGWRTLAAMALGLWVLVAAGASMGMWGITRKQQALAKLANKAEAVRQQAEEEMRVKAFYDHLTGLPNRRLLLDRMAQLLATNVRHARCSALVFLDLDGFKGLNDAHGHEQGDRLLQEVARRLQAVTREEDTVARWAGDEFVVMLSDLSGNAGRAAEVAQEVALKMRTVLAADYELNDGLRWRSTASLGVTLFGERDEPLDDIIKRADAAMYRAKSAGKNEVRMHT